jgi:serine/threonine protein kinase
MDSARWHQVKQLFNQALERPEAERHAFLSAASGGDEELRAAVAALLADAEAGEFLSSPTMDDGNDPRHADASAVFRQLQRVLAGRFSLEREIGRGGMGLVYLTRDVTLDRPVAIKVLPPRLAADPEYRTRFLREARTAAGLSHPNIVPIHLVEERDGLVYFVMAYVDGESLGDRVRRAGPLRPAEVARLVQEVAWALGYAHGRGVIHRDVKPDNILLDKGSALVTDFGIARVAAARAVAALENLRLDLLRLRAGVGSADDLTASIEEARSVGEAVEVELSARREVESLAGRHSAPSK